MGIYFGGYWLLLESLRRIEEAAGGQRLAALRWIFLAVLAAGGAVGRAAFPMEMRAVYQDIPNLIWAGLAIRRLFITFTAGVLLWLLQRVYQAVEGVSATRRSTQA